MRDASKWIKCVALIWDLFESFFQADVDNAQVREVI